MKELSKFITCKQYSNKWQDSGEMKIDPTQVSYIESVPTRNNYGSRVGDHSKIHTIFGSIIEIDEEPEKVEEKINKWYREEDKENVNTITISKDDLVKNFIFRNLAQ